MPWKPAMTTMLSFLKNFLIFSELIYFILALLKISDVIIPAWAPVKDMALYPNSDMAKESKAIVTCSPVDKSVSSSLPLASTLIDFANSVS